MNRKGIKAAAKQSLKEAGPSVRRITLIFLLAIWVLAAANWGVELLEERMAAGGGHLSDMVSAQTRAFVLGVVISLVLQMAAVLLAMGYGALGLRISRREEFSARTLLEGFSSWGRGILLYLLSSLLLSLWGMLLTMPLSYILATAYVLELITMDQAVWILTGLMAVAMAIWSYRYRMAWFILIDRPELSARQVLSQAKQVNRGSRVRIFLLDLSFLPWMLLCAVTLGIAGIWKLPYLVTAYAQAYNAMLVQAEDRQRRTQELIRQRNMQM